MEEKEIAIIGGGASGMVAAVSASTVLVGKDIALIEKNPVLGKKIHATGNGKCNFSNRFCRWEDYNKSGQLHVRGAFKCLSPKDTVVLFEKIGILAREDRDGRLYPFSGQAAAITEAFRDELMTRGVDIRLNSEVLRIDRQEDKFIVSLGDDKISAKKLIIATGGKAGLKYGSTGDGYGFAKKFGHQLKRPLPSLVQVITDDKRGRLLKGVRAKGEVSLIKNNTVIEREKGEIQFTETGMSGICVFDLSRHMDEKVLDFKIAIDLLPEHTIYEVTKILLERKVNMGGRACRNLLLGILNEKLVPIYLEEAGINEKQLISELDELHCRRLASLMKGRTVGVKGTKGWVEAQVTSGGVKNSEVYAENLESKLVPGLFFAGEILDVDGRCGGWNLQWAFSSGYTAGLHASKEVKI